MHTQQTTFHMLLMWGMTSIRATVVSQDPQQFSLKNGNRLYVQLEIRLYASHWIKPNYLFCFLLQQERRSQQPTPALHVSSPTAAPGSCCSMLRTPMDFVSTWKVNTAALSPHGWVDPPPLVGVQTALLSRLFTASICLPMQALSTFFASRAQAQEEGTVLG